MNRKAELAIAGVLGLGLIFYVYSKNKGSTNQSNVGNTIQTTTNSVPGLGTNTMLSNPQSPQSQWMNPGSMITLNGLAVGAPVTGAYVQILQNGLPTQYFVIVPGANGSSDVQNFLTNLGWQQVSVQTYKVAVATQANTFDLSQAIPVSAPTPIQGTQGDGENSSGVGPDPLTESQWQQQLAFLKSAGASQSTIQQEAVFYGHPGEY